MSTVSRPREVGRGERVVRGVWRLRLPLPWPGIPHCNAWAVAAGDGIVLFDCGMHGPGLLPELERALDQVGLGLEQVRLLVCTHAHSDHYGQAADVVRRAGCELWMHPDHAHATQTAGDPDEAIARRIEVARQSGVPEEPLRRWAESTRTHAYGIGEVVLPDRPLLDGVEVDTELGPWRAIETPGHAPSHVCLVQSERRLLISGDHVLGRASLYFDFGWTPDPAGEFLASLERVEGGGARLGLSGHGKPFTDVDGHVRASRGLVRERLAATAQALDEGPRTAFEIIGEVHGAEVRPPDGQRWLTETLCYLTHLERTGRVVRDPGEPERWRLA